MRWARTMHLLDVHCEGESGRVAFGGVPRLPGDSLAQTLEHLNTVDDSLRRFLCLEPRSSPSQWTNLLLPPRREGADAGFIILGPDRAHAMSGSNTICVTTALLEYGLVEMREPETVVRLDTAAGLVTATARCRDGRCEQVSVTMVPSFVEQLDLEVDSEQFGSVLVDIAYGGIFYAIVDVSSVGLRIEPGAARDLVEAGMRIKDAVNSQFPVAHPRCRRSTESPS